MVEEAKQEIWAATEWRETAIGLLADLFFRLGRSLAQPVLDVSMTTLLGVQFGGIRRRSLHVEFGMLSQELLHHRRSMHPQPVPNQDHRPTDAAPGVLQEHDHSTGVCPLGAQVVRASTW